MSKFDEKIEIMRSVSESLVPYNFPVGPVELEYYIAPLKRCEAEVDGYTVVFHLNRAKYKDHYLETFQVHNKHAPFLPFHLVAKLARKVLGGHHLSLVEFYQVEHKIYCWSVCLDERGRPIDSPIKEKSKPAEFEGFRYVYITPEQLNLY
jgi:hypothetical protein